MIFEKEDKLAQDLMYGGKMKIPARKPYLVVYTKFDEVDPINGQDYTIQKVVWALSESAARRIVKDEAGKRPELIEIQSVNRFSVWEVIMEKQAYTVLYTYQSVIDRDAIAYVNKEATITVWADTERWARRIAAIQLGISQSRIKSITPLRTWHSLDTKKVDKRQQNW